MGSPTVTAIGRRAPYPEAPFELSALALTVDTPTRPADGDATVQLLRRARDAGITTFDTVDSPAPRVAETLLARAFPDGDGSVVVLTPQGPTGPGPRLPRSPARGAPGAVPSPVEQALGEGPPSGRFHRLYEVSAEDLLGPGGPSSLDGPQVPRPPGPVVVRCRSAKDVSVAARRPAPRLLSGPFSLLDRTFASAAVREMGAEGLAWIARDPFAGGRLDGRRFAPSPEGPWTATPRTLRELEVDFEPVARLAFLARPRRRTLAQAALHYVTGQPWVATTCIPLPAPERWTEIIGFRASPPLDPDEWARAESFGPSGSALRPRGAPP